MLRFLVLCGGYPWFLLSKAEAHGSSVNAAAIPHPLPPKCFFWSATGLLHQLRRLCTFEILPRLNLGPGTCPSSP
ncbi:hypothetical protein B0H19DRAFT_1149805 [Mycena capillaripes]|nr:hypothetical protein B0H19DRAFT_1149805 [Mycena capillaripes]